MSRSPDLPLIGWRERIDLPDWNVRRIRAKIDTGARTSAIHVGHIDRLEDGRVRFEVVTREKPKRRTQWVDADIVRTSVIKSSHGDSQERIVCATEMEIGGIRNEIELSLVCREGMLCRMLLGRRALEGHFLVDPSRKYLLTELPRPRPKRSPRDQGS